MRNSPRLSAAAAVFLAILLPVNLSEYAFGRNRGSKVVSTQNCPCGQISLLPGARSICGPAWSETKTTAQSNSFYAISALSRTDVWAVGSHYDGSNDRPLAEHFDGRRWTVVTV